MDLENNQPPLQPKEVDPDRCWQRGLKKTEEATDKNGYLLKW